MGITFRFKMNYLVLPFLFGRQGCAIDRIRRSTNCQITNEQNVFTITGLEANVLEAQNRMIDQSVVGINNDLIKKLQSLPPNEVGDSMNIKVQPWVISRTMMLNVSHNLVLQARQRQYINTLPLGSILEDLTA